jgi:hypothetical protein
MLRGGPYDGIQGEWAISIDPKTKLNYVVFKCNHVEPMQQSGWEEDAWDWYAEDNNDFRDFLYVGTTVNYKNPHFDELLKELI